MERKQEYIETWKAIAFEMGRSERWCRYMSVHPNHPLPVFKVGGIVRILHSDLNKWLEEQRMQLLRPLVA